MTAAGVMRQQPSWSRVVISGLSGETVRGIGWIAECQASGAVTGLTAASNHVRSRILVIWPFPTKQSQKQQARQQE